MWDRFRERFTLITGESAANAFGQNVWVENDLAVASIGLAIQDHILPRLEQATWDLVIFDEARKLSAYRYGSSGQIDETKRYKLAERRTQIRHQEMLLPGTGGEGDSQEGELRHPPGGAREEEAHFLETEAAGE